MKVVSITVFFIALFHSCSSLKYQSKYSSKEALKADLDLYVGYQYFAEGKNVDINLLDSTKNSTIYEIYCLLLAADRSRRFENKNLNINKNLMELELILKIHNRDNKKSYYWLSLFTLHIIPYYIEQSVQLEGTFKDRNLNSKIKKNSPTGHMKLYFGLFPFLLNTFSGNEERTRFYELMLNDLFAELNI